MTRIIESIKMHGAGNDYIYINTTHYLIGNPEKLSKEWGALRMGIGSDGLVLIGRSGKADFSMCIFNVDGSEVKMYGNASRYIGKYPYDYKLTSKTGVTLDALSGIKTLKLHMEDNKVDTVTVNMGTPTCEPAYYDGKESKPMKEHPIEIDEVRYTGTTVSVGNPHLVIFVNGITRADLPVVSPELGNHLFFPKRINMEFTRVLGEGRMRIRVWERGSGIIQACGTGACATAVAAFPTGRFGKKATVIMDREMLIIEWDVVTGYIFMAGSAIRVFDGEAEANDEQDGSHLKQQRYGISEQTFFEAAGQLSVLEHSQKDQYSQDNAP